MGKRGPSKEPAELKERKGTRRPSRDPEPLEVDYALPSCPFRVGSPEAESWDRVLTIMKQSGLDSILTVADEGALEGAAVAWTRARQASADYANLSPGSRYVQTRSNGLRPHPARDVERSAWAEFKSWMSQLGLSPSARASLSMDSTGGGAGSVKPEDDLDRLTKAMLGAKPIEIFDDED